MSHLIFGKEKYLNDKVWCIPDNNKVWYRLNELLSKLDSCVNKLKFKFKLTNISLISHWYQITSHRHHSFAVVFLTE